MKSIVALLTCAMTLNSMAGMIITKTNKITFGPVKESKSKVHISVKIGKASGKMPYSKKLLRWYTTDKDVVNLYTAAKMAYDSKQYKVALYLAKECATKEPQFKIKANELIALMTNLDKTKNHKNDTSKESAGDDNSGPNAAETATTTAKTNAKADDDAASAAGDDEADASTNVIYKLVKGNLLDGSQGTPKPYDAKKLLKAKYYFLCFTTLEFPGYRDALRLRIMHAYTLMSKDYPGKFEFIFIPTSKKPTYLMKYLPEMKLPFPILKRQVAAKSKMNVIRGNSNHMFAVVTPDGKVVSNEYGPLKGIDPKKVLRGLEDILAASASK